MSRRSSKVSRVALMIVFALTLCLVILSLMIRQNDSSDSDTKSSNLSEARRLSSEELAAARKEKIDQEQEKIRQDPQFQVTPAGICEVIRNGDLTTLKFILREKPELIHATNPHNWAQLPEMRIFPWADQPAELAVIFGQYEILELLLSLGATEKNPIGGYYEAFDIARKAKDQKAINVIVSDAIRRITEEPDLATYTRENGWTFLHFASENQHAELMRELLNRGADPSAATKKGLQPIHYVAGDNEATRALLYHGIEHTLWVAVAMNDLERAREILANDPSQVARNFHPASHHSDGLPLVKAAVSDQIEMLKLLLAHGADVDGKLEDRQFGDLGYGLIEAFSAGHYDVVNLLLDHGADTSAWVDSDYSFKVRVRESDHQQIKDRVLTPEEQNPPVKSPGFKAWTGEIVGDIRQLPPPSPDEALGAISAAIVSHNRHHDYANYKEIITVMLEQGADQNLSMNPTAEEIETTHPRHRNRFGTPLHWLATEYLNKHNYSPNPDIPTTEELVDLAALFIKHDAKIEARHPVTNHTPLSSAVNEGVTEYVKFLLKNGATINRDDPPETNPVIIARNLGFQEISALLTE